MRPITIHERVAQNLAAQSEPFLTGLLLAVAVVLVCIAFTPHHIMLKAAAAAWVILP